MIVYDVATTTRFRGLERREGMIWRGEAGWAEWSPFREYDDREAAAWLAAAHEAADLGWPEPVREVVAVNVTIPAVAPEVAAARVRASGCTTAKVKVAERGQTFADDMARVEAVRDALGPAGHVRIDANGGWEVSEAQRRLRELARFGLEYAEQPCADVEDLAELRISLAHAGIDVLIAADESIRRSGDPEQVAELDAADVVVLKVQPLGGVRRCLDLAERLGLPVVVSSALETSIGLRAGLALAAALPELPYACGLNTADLLAADVVAEPLVAVDGAIRVRDVEPDDEMLAAARADSSVGEWWNRRHTRVSAILGA